MPLIVGCALAVSAAIVGELYPRLAAYGQSRATDDSSRLVLLVALALAGAANASRPTLCLLLTLLSVAAWLDLKYHRIGLLVQAMLLSVSLAVAWGDGERVGMGLLLCGVSYLGGFLLLRARKGNAPGLGDACILTCIGFTAGLASGLALLIAVALIILGQTLRGVKAEARIPLALPLSLGLMATLVVMSLAPVV